LDCPVTLPPQGSTHQVCFYRFKHGGPQTTWFGLPFLLPAPHAALPHTIFCYPTPLPTYHAVELPHPRYHGPRCACLRDSTCLPHCTRRCRRGWFGIYYCPRTPVAAQDAPSGLLRLPPRFHCRCYTTADPSGITTTVATWTWMHLRLTFSGRATTVGYLDRLCRVRARGTTYRFWFGFATGPRCAWMWFWFCSGRLPPPTVSSLVLFGTATNANTILPVG